jgi:HPt (histidine-containing phosphotransfer) domain-containing protein
VDLLRVVGTHALSEVPAAVRRLREAAAAGAAPRVAAEAHGLKGMLATLGGGDAAAHAAEAERAARAGDLGKARAEAAEVERRAEEFVRSLADDLLRASATSDPARGGAPGSGRGGAPA